ncbi:HupE/UreJ family protein [Pantanalinema sp. GBBB05]|uniref:HupE/UreJ family protein n=1 Tax=Pantanalinema sp. GBBB05 TaxID=2604139 RepID=UPI001DC7A0B8|nr:HupE/UreJ family protein [Pantanalinema sp. GBBB05]
MVQFSALSQFNLSAKQAWSSLPRWCSGMAIAVGLLMIATPAQAHHALGGKTPTNFFEGFLSGLAHPIIGIDHFAFVVAVGLLAAVMQQRILLPVVFVLAAMAGTGLHLMRIDLPGSELFVGASIVTVGLLLALKNRPQPLITIALGAIAGIFHGYAYGESIVGADMTPLVAYLAGFTVIQLVVALSAFSVGQRLITRSAEAFPLALRFAGFTLCGFGVAFLTSGLK